MTTIGIVPCCPEFGRDRMFDLSSPFNRDHSLQMWYDFRRSCRQRGWEVGTLDELTQEFDVYLLLDPYPSKLKMLGPERLKRTIAMFGEVPQVAPRQFTKENLECVSISCPIVLCYNEGLCREYGFTYCVEYVDLYPAREERVVRAKDRQGICIIASNKYKRHPDSQLSFRLELVRRVAADAAVRDEFFIYGCCWLNAVGVLRGMVPEPLAARVPLIDKVLLRCERRLPWNRGLRRNCRGVVESKGEVLARCRFNIAVENTFWDGYVSEKLFDALQFGCIPIYFGAPNVNEYVPPNLFIDGRAFSDPLDAIHAAFALTDTEVDRMAGEGQDWLRSEEFETKFGRQSYIRMLQEHISILADRA